VDDPAPKAVDIRFLKYEWIMGTSRITVAVCTLNRGHKLTACLEALRKQTMASSEYDVFVVDNGSTDETREISRAWEREHANFHYLHEPVTGLSRARNTALSHAATPYLAYIDDDAIPQENWLEELVRPFSLDLRPAVVGGDLDPVWEAPRPDWLIDGFLHQYSVSLCWDTGPRPITGEEWLCEANIAFEVEALAAAGGFDETLGRRGPLLLSGENFVNEIIRRGGRCLYYTPLARASHLIPGSRLTLDWLRQRCFWGGVTKSVIMYEEERRFGTKTPWRDLLLPSSCNDWAVMLNPLADCGLPQQTKWLHDLGWLLHRKGFIAA
jgi:glucosyl-dolichyl phosphate glucuronosyltransferase